MGNLGPGLNNSKKNLQRISGNLQKAESFEVITTVVGTGPMLQRPSQPTSQPPPSTQPSPFAVLPPFVGGACTTDREDVPMYLPDNELEGGVEGYLDQFLDRVGAVTVSPTCPCRVPIEDALAALTAHKGDTDAAAASLEQKVCRQRWSEDDTHALRASLSQYGANLSRVQRTLRTASPRPLSQVVEAYYRTCHIAMGLDDVRGEPMWTMGKRRAVAKRRPVAVDSDTLLRSLIAMLAHGLIEAGDGVISIIGGHGTPLFADLLVDGSIRHTDAGRAQLFRNPGLFARSITVRATLASSHPMRRHRGGREAASTLPPASNRAHAPLALP